MTHLLTGPWGFLPATPEELSATGVVLAVDQVQIGFTSRLLRAHTEHRGVGAGSVEALVDC